MFGDIRAIDHRDHLASIYYMLTLGIDLLTVFRPMTFMVSFLLFFFKFLAFQSCYFLFLKAWKLVDIAFSSIVSSHWPAISWFCPFVSYSFSRTQSTVSGKFYLLPSLFLFNLLAPVHMFSCVSFYHSFFSFVPGNLVGWKIWVCTEICFISFDCVIFLISASRCFPGCVKRTKT